MGKFLASPLSIRLGLETGTSAFLFSSSMKSPNESINLCGSLFKFYIHSLDAHVCTSTAL